MPHKNPKSERLILLDAHAILHRAYHALPEFSTSKGEPTGALYGLSSMLLKIISEFKPDHVAACYDLPGPTYRHEAYEAYKAHRKKADDDLVAQMGRSRDIFRAFHIPIYEHPGFEADDCLGGIVEQVSKAKSNIEIIIASGDMDTMQLVDDDKVKVFTLKKGIQDTVLYDEKSVIERFGFPPKLLPDFKGLRGDPSDNIIGIAGIGEKTATDLIKKIGSIEEIYKLLKKNRDQLLKMGFKERIVKLLEENEEEALFSKMLATIRRDTPIKFVFPEEKWIDNFKPEEVENLFADLEFRGLKNRVRALSGEEPQERQISFNEIANETVSTAELEETKIALWLLNSSISNPSLDDILHFAKTRDFEKAKQVIFEELKKQNLLSVFENIEKPLIPIIKKMEERGVLIDKDFLKKLSKEYHHELSALEKKIYKLAGEEFNINSPKQLSVILFDKLGLVIKGHKKTEGGAKSTRESELEKLRGHHEIVDSIISHRELQKLLSTYIDNIPQMLGEDSRLHTKFLQTGTTTGRMSSQNPNLQNIPIKTDLGRKIRDAFLPTRGFKLVSFDYAQIELKIAAFLSGDKKLIEIFKGGEDVHSAVASEVFGVPVKDVTKEMRRQAKVINFGILYGMGVNALKANLGSSREEAQRFYDSYFQTFEGLAKYLDRVKTEVSRRGYTETLFGRRRYFEGINSKIPYIKAAAERMAINAPMQGTQADIIKQAMIRIDDFLKEKNMEDSVFLLLQVHDELIFEIKKDLVEEALKEIKKIMESVVSLEETKGIVLSAGVSVGENWGEMEKV